MQKIPEKLTDEQRISQLASFPPMVQFMGVLVGAVFEVVYPTHLFPEKAAHIIGVVFLALATIVIVWSQKSSAEFRRREKEGKERNFHLGPFRYSKNPTSFSLALLIIGLGFLLNSLMIISGAVVAYWLSYIVYHKQKEKILTAKYSDDYENYKKKIGSIF